MKPVMAELCKQDGIGVIAFQFTAPSFIGGRAITPGRFMLVWMATFSAMRWLKAAV